ncbi:chondroitin sulfate synthase 3 [Solea senegalensis]|uniref:Hexosyltransferase n=1 Tax=Solea senegalensis TaxID=28829 RepID=A0AAV6PB36_SOLSE|nr:chondroitin sulfate synthase 3-like [Solea senegalensis]XP_043909534.1 chondroitin sulfate synthase 3-like [Solea senegalensis]KAG7453777.1 chondroitin sulfate synthase 3 [Solea senegalensis]KAG7498738.1 chondroitin sulfate synthase 3 [Solea senegalensis]
MALKSRRPWTTVVIGVFLGFTASSWLFAPQVDDRRKKGPTCFYRDSSVGEGPPGVLGRSAGSREQEEVLGPGSKSGDGGPKRFLYVGVMTAKKYLSSRAVAAHQTWTSSIPGRVEFFSSAGSAAVHTDVPVPVVSLAGVDDSYPPQKKSFMMLKYIHDHYLDQYEWFMRADDDVYIKGEKLESFLRSLNSSKPLYLGQTGLGMTEELGRLALEPGENFCMGGPGMIFSREVLRRMVPHISTCLREMYTTHEDVEVGRCVRRFGGTQCVWSYEMQQLFYENYEHNKKGFIEELHSSKIHNAITLHPNKNPAYQYRLHSFTLSREISRLRYRTVLLHRDSLVMSYLSDTEVQWEDQQLGSPPSYMHYQPSERKDVIEWDFLTGRHVYSADESKTARQSLGNSLRTALEDVIMQVMEIINQNSKTQGRAIDFKKIQYGYYRVDPMHGAEYILDLLLLYKKHKGRKIKVPVRRHAYLQQAFSRPFFTESEELDVAELVAVINSESQSLSFLSNSLKFLSPFQFYESTREVWKQNQEKVHIVLPLSGRYDTFVHFMENFEKVCLIAKQNVKLSVVLVDNESSQISEAYIQLIKEYHRKYPTADISLIPMTGNFSRGLALELGSSRLHNDTLLFFCDVDLVFSADALQRCRDNTVQSKQVYFPVVFSQYNPKIVYAEKTLRENKYVLTKKSGFWRDYGFGITCIFKSDLLKAGGFDTSIFGWGMEDVDLYTKVISTGFKVLRSHDPGIFHVYHPVHCNASLEQKQYKMCLGSRASTFASTVQLAELWLEKHAENGYNRTSS